MEKFLPIKCIIARPDSALSVLNQKIIEVMLPFLVGACKVKFWL
jgi:hypothetical protein